MKQIVHLIYILVAAATLAACDTHHELPAAQGQEVMLVIPEYPAEYTATTRTPTDKTAWAEGDILYIRLYCGGADVITQHIARRTAAGDWQMDKPLTIPPATTYFNINAWYTAGTQPGQPITGDLLFSFYDGQPDETTIALPAFDHYYSRITFTNLAADDRIEFEGWRHYKLDDAYQLVSPTDPDPITAVGESITLYARIPGSTATRTYPFRILPGGDAGKATAYFHFDPGTPNADGTTDGNYRNRAYTIDCAPLMQSGGQTPGRWEKEEEPEPKRFLAWANGGYKTEDFTLQCDIDLTGITMEPIGDGEYFTNTFDGGGHTITGLKVEGSGKAGIFYRIGSGGTVKNLHLREVSIKGEYASGIAYHNDGTITGCTVQGKVEGSNVTCGITYSNSGTITGCAFCGTLSSDFTGGIVRVNNGGSIIGCYALATGGSNHYPIAYDLNGGTTTGSIGKGEDDTLTDEDIITMNEALAAGNYTLQWKRDGDTVAIEE